MGYTNSGLVAYGKSELAQNANNCFGMKKSLSGNTWAGSSWDGKSIYTKKTGEQNPDGSYVTITADFRKYPCVEDSIADHSAYLLGAMNGSKQRYSGLKGCADYKKAAQIIKDGGYATSLTYVSKLCEIIERWNLTQYDVKAAATATEQKTEEKIVLSGTHSKYIDSTGTHYISNSGSDENGAYRGGQAGDQTGKEWQMRSWYNRPWLVVLRYPDQKVALKLLTILSAFAQEESRNISENLKWGLRKRYEMGQSRWSALYGFRLDEKGEAVIEPGEGEIVRSIFDLYREGTTLPEIVTKLNDLKITSPRGKKWTESTYPCGRALRDLSEPG